MHSLRFCALAILAFWTPAVAEDDEEGLPDCAWYLGTIGDKDVQFGLAIDANATRPRRVTGSYFYADWNAYTGGAHGNTGSVGMTFALRGEQAVQLRLADLFKPTTGWLTRLSNLCVRDLKRQGASSVPEKFTGDDLSKFTITPGGLTFYFDPYEVGCYAEGPYEVTVPWTRLEGTLSEAGQSAARVRVLTTDRRRPLTPYDRLGAVP